MRHKPVKYWQYYEIKDEKLIRKRNWCKKCGDTLMAIHKEKDKIRYYCGKCHATIIQKI